MRNPTSFHLINLLKKTIGEPKLGAEIGVYKAQTSKALLDEFSELYLSLIDPWKEWKEGSTYWDHRKTGKFEQYEWDKIYNEAMLNIQFQHRASVYKMTSEEAASEFEDKSLDFVFLDGDHQTEKIRLDLKLWIPKIRNGGIITGHDYGSRCHGIKIAILEVFKEEDLILCDCHVWGKVLND